MIQAQDKPKPQAKHLSPSHGITQAAEILSHLRDKHVYVFVYIIPLPETRIDDISDEKHSREPDSHSRLRPLNNSRRILLLLNRRNQRKLVSNI